LAPAVVGEAPERAEAVEAGLDFVLAVGEFEFEGFAAAVAPGDRIGHLAVAAHPRLDPSEFACAVPKVLLRAPHEAGIDRGALAAEADGLEPFDSGQVRALQAEVVEVEDQIS